MTAPHRTHAGPVLPCRPALTWWQRVAVRALGSGCAGWRWYRAHVGGRWVHMRTDELSGEWQPVAACPEWSAVGRECGAGDTCVGCEVYPYASLCAPRELAAAVAESAVTFDEFRRWYERVRIVDLGKVKQ